MLNVQSFIESNCRGVSRTIPVTVPFEDIVQTGWQAYLELKNKFDEREDIRETYGEGEEGLIAFLLRAFQRHVKHLLKSTYREYSVHLGRVHPVSLAFDSPLWEQYAMPEEPIDVREIFKDAGLTEAEIKWATHKYLKKASWDEMAEIFGENPRSYYLQILSKTTREKLRACLSST